VSPGSGIDQDSVIALGDFVEQCMFGIGLKKIQIWDWGTDDLGDQRCEPIDLVIDGRQSCAAVNGRFSCAEEIEIDSMGN
jgi:hypothetical protein